MPGVESTTKKQLLTHQFLAGLPPAVSRQLRAAGEAELEETVERACLLMALDDQEQTAAVTADNTQLRQLEEQIAALTEQAAALTIISVHQKDISGAIRLDNYSAIAQPTEKQDTVGVAFCVAFPGIWQRNAIRETETGCLCSAADNPSINQPFH